MTDANGRVTRTTHDGADRVLSVVRQGYVADPRGASSAPPARDVVIERHEYDKAGNETRVVQGAPGGADNWSQVTTDYDGAGWVVRTVAENGDQDRVTEFSRDRNGNEVCRSLTSAALPAGEDVCAVAGRNGVEGVRTTYDTRDLVTSEATVLVGDDPATGGTNEEQLLVTRYGYDRQGNRTTATDPRGAANTAAQTGAGAFTTTTEYDAADNPTRERGPQRNLSSGLGHFLKNS